MNARQARELFEANKHKRLDMSRTIAAIEREIETIAGNGYSVNEHPNRGALSVLEEDRVQVVREHFIRQGFTWHDNGSISW